MTWLNAALAFAITMLILSMVTSTFVETIHRCIGLREKGLRIMLDQFYDRVMGPYMQKAGANPAEMKEAFLDLMTLNRAPTGVAGKASAKAGVSSSDTTDVDKGLLSRMWSGRRLAKLNAGEFMSKLGGGEYGDHLRRALADVADPDQALKGLAEEFDNFGREASIFFERRARLTSILIAIVVAVAMYVQPYQLFSAYLTDPDVANAVIAMKDDVLKQYENAAMQAEEARKVAEANPNDNALKAGAVAAAKQESGLKEALDRSLAAKKDATEKLQTAGAPVGWTDERWDSMWKFKNESGGEQSADAWNSLKTLFWLLVGGLLVGLGGPFWYDMVKSLSSIGALLTGAKAVASSASASDGGATTTPPATAVEHFNAATASRDAATKNSETRDDEPVG